MNTSRFHQRLRLAPLRVQAAWRRVSSPLAILDSRCPEWLGTPPTTRINIVRALDVEGLMPALIGEHIREHLTSRSQVLVGLGAALRSYREAGILLEVPTSTVMQDTNTHPIYMAAVSRLLERDQVGRHDYQWLHEEIVRLGRACINWCEMEHQRDSMGETLKAASPEPLLDAGMEGDLP